MPPSPLGNLEPSNPRGGTKSAVQKLAPVKPVKTLGNPVKLSFMMWFHPIFHSND